MALVYDVVEITNPNSAGTQDVNHGLGVTPELALFFASNATANNGTAGGEACLSMGAHDGTNSYCMAVFSEDGQSSTDATRRGQSDEVIHIMHNAAGSSTAGGNNDEADVSSWDSSKVVLNWEIDDTSNQYKVIMVVMAGLGSSEVLQPSIQDNDTTTTSDQADGGLAWTNGTSPNDSIGNNFGGTSFGAFYDSGSGIGNYMQWLFEDDGQASGSPAAVFKDGVGSNQHLIATGSGADINRAYGIDAIGATSVTWDLVEGSTNALEHILVPITMPTGKGLHAGFDSSPTSTGTQSITGLGFKPGLIIFFAGLRNNDTVNPGGNDRAGSMMIGATDGTTTLSLCVHIEDGAATTNTGSAMSNGTLGVLEDDGASYRIEASVDSLDSDGFTLDWTTVDATYGFRFGWLALEEEGGAGTDALTASELTASAPVLDTPTIGQEHVLTAAELAASAPVLDAATLGQTHALSADELTGSAPTLESPTIAEVHVLTADEISSGTPVLDSPTIGQTHALTADEISSGTPALDAAAIGQEHALTADEISSGTPVLDSPTLAEGSHALTADELTAGTPTLESPTIGQVHALTATELDAGAAVLDTPTIGQVHTLTADELLSGTPTLEQPTLAEDTDNLTASDLQAGTPALETPALGQAHALAADEITATAPVLGSPTLAEVHALAADEIVAGTPVLDSPTLGTIHNLLASGIDASAPQLADPTLGQEHVLLAAELFAGSPVLAAPTLSGPGVVVTVGPRVRPHPLRVHIAGVAPEIIEGRALTSLEVKQQRAMPIYLVGIAGNQTMIAGEAVTPTGVYRLPRQDREPIPTYIAGSALTDDIPSAYDGRIQKDKPWPWYIVGTVGPVPIIPSQFGEWPPDLGETDELATPVYIAGCIPAIAAGYELDQRDIARGATGKHLFVRNYRAPVLNIYLSGSNNILWSPGASSVILATEGSMALLREDGGLIEV